MIDDRSLQRWLSTKGHYAGAVDGIAGRQTRRAIEAAVKAYGARGAASWDASRQRIAVEQMMMRDLGIDAGKVDGLVGSQTLFAWEQWQNAARDIEPLSSDVNHMPATFPRQRDMAAFYGKPGTGHVRLDLPFPMVLAWDLDREMRQITVHGKCHDSFKAALTNAHQHYGMAGIVDLGLNLFGGCYNNRKMRGGSQLSTHAYACAIDFDPARNQLRWGRDRARLAKPDARRFFELCNEQGLVGLGPERNYDWMHVQAARL